MLTYEWVGFPLVAEMQMIGVDVIVEGVADKPVGG
jgi:hypothetical protein